MGIFRRKKDVDTEAGADDAVRLDEAPDEPVAADPDDAARDDRAEDTGDETDVAGDESEDAEDDAAGAVRVDRSEGPFDRDEVDERGQRLDLGSLWVAGLPGMELRLEVDEESQNIVAASALLGESAVQLQAFAAPKSSGVWDDIRDEISQSITAQGGTAEVVEGPLGLELQTRMPSRGSNGRTTYSPARFVGVDGPRWFLRAVVSGKAAVDPDAGSALVDFIRQTVVVRGAEAMAPRELLPLRLPEEMAAAAEQAGQIGQVEEGEDRFGPLERGPEITEIR
ncbi:MAG TPA: DUF3710 domain-containing protein [Segeticoccus sp.]|uniref:DUF3710 domain-containing protein n=1 Tax=Segeticoccus sp. TaxID=2706531 RepID=UPI002D7EBFE4|nr:DUF3710 domain-containing protein [Segeticoccus sp.]HET8601434.1 DUF3710 domain-containing protein [Segeticoccus sp.]